MYALTEGGGTGAYTDAQLRARLLGPSAAVGVRFEILDENLEPIGEGDAGHLTTVHAASIDQDGTRLVPGSLKLTMLPDPLLPIDTTVPLTRFVRPWWRLRMEDGGIAEWPQGVYVWTRPGETITGQGTSRWDVVLGDLSHLLSITGPELDGFLIGTGNNLTATISEIYRRALGVDTDLARIVGSDAAASSALYWPLVAANAGTSPVPGPGMTLLQGTPATSWQTILQTIHTAIGYQPPRCGWLGEPVARPFPVNLFAVPADHTFTTDQESIIEANITKQPRLDLFANRVVAYANSAGANAIQGNAIADANDYLPGHLWSQQSCKRYVTAVLNNATAGDQRALLASAVAELYVRMASVSEATIETQMWPTVEPWDVIGVEQDGAVTRFLASGYSCDLLSGKMKFKLPQIVNAAEPVVSEIVTTVTSPDEEVATDLLLISAGGDYILVDSGGDRILVS